MDGTFKILTVADIVTVNRSMITRFGGFYVEADQNLGNPGALEYVFEAIQGSLFGQDLYPTLIEKAAVLCWKIIRNHVFHDGNKRTGMEVCRLFLDLNGYDMRIDRVVVGAVVFGLTICYKVAMYVVTAGQYCSGTGTGSTRFYRVCNDLSLVLLLFVDLIIFIACLFLLKHDIKKPYAFLVVIAYGIYALLSPFLWDLPFFLTATR
jgi:death-on-curing protein